MLITAKDHDLTMHLKKKKRFVHKQRISLLEETKLSLINKVSFHIMSKAPLAKEDLNIWQPECQICQAMMEYIEQALLWNVLRFIPEMEMTKDSVYQTWISHLPFIIGRIPI